MRKKIYAYYKPILLINQDEQFAQANVWKTSWERAGWECSMLNSSHAAACPFFSVIHGKIAAHSRITPGLGLEIGEKVQSRFARWGALFGVGGGWMSDYDVVNLGFTPAMADEIEKQTDIAMNTGDEAWVFYATHRESYVACKDYVERNLFKKRDPSKLEPESKVLGIKKNFFKGNETLIHVTGENKSLQMQKLFWDHVNPGKISVAEEKLRNRK